ncbi:phospholipase A and acyltransferase 2-like [Amphiura filiformis]|uniref:phospholipase A and acyltransferase 2-like n=1 Tax=Amphiura filiformis TaxID=82378 RepID=UPI003B21A81A
MSDDHFALTTEWAPADSLTPKAGDIIEFNRGPYNHVGIADGREGIYHFNGEPGIPEPFARQRESACWRHDTINDVAKGDCVRINNSLDSKRNFTAFDRDYIIRRCECSLGLFVNKFDIVVNNCEHKATEMRYGLSTSQQVTTLILKGVYTVGMSTGVVAGGVALGPVGVAAAGGGLLVAGGGLLLGSVIKMIKKKNNDIS